MFDEMRRGGRESFIKGIGEDEVRGFERRDEIGLGERGS